MNRNQSPGRVKNPCRVCGLTVANKAGIQCKGACSRWAHYRCLGYSPKKILDIRDGKVEITCPCPHCNLKQLDHDLFKNDKTKCEPVDGICPSVEVEPRLKVPPLGIPYGGFNQSMTPLQSRSEKKLTEERNAAPIPIPIPVPVPVPGLAPLSDPLLDNLPQSVPVPLPDNLPLSVPVPGLAPLADPLLDNLPQSVPVPLSVPLPDNLPQSVPVPLSVPLPVNLPQSVPVPLSVPLPVNLPQSVPLPNSAPIVNTVPLPKTVSFPNSVPLPDTIPASVPLPVSVPQPNALPTFDTTQQRSMEQNTTPIPCGVNPPCGPNPPCSFPPVFAPYSRCGQQPLKKMPYKEKNYKYKLASKPCRTPSLSLTPSDTSLISPGDSPKPSILCDAPICDKNICSPRAPCRSYSSSRTISDNQSPHPPTNPENTNDESTQPPQLPIEVTVKDQPIQSDAPCWSCKCWLGTNLSEFKCTSSMCPNKGLRSTPVPPKETPPKFRSTGTCTDNKSKSCTCIKVMTAHKYEKGPASASDSQLFGKQQTLLLTAIDQLCDTVGQLSGQIQMLMTKMATQKV